MIHSTDVRLKRNVDQGSQKEKVFLGEVRTNLGSGSGCRCGCVEDRMRPMQRCLGRKLQSTLEVGCGGVINKLQS